MFVGACSRQRGGCEEMLTLLWLVESWHTDGLRQGKTHGFRYPELRWGELFCCIK